MHLPPSGRIHPLSGLTIIVDSPRFQAPRAGNTAVWRPGTSARCFSRYLSKIRKVMCRL